MERLILLEHTTPKESLLSGRCADGGGTPGGVDGRGSRAGTYPKEVAAGMVSFSINNTRENQWGFRRSRTMVAALCAQCFCSGGCGLLL